MELCWFAICAVLAFIPWISAEEKLLYQTPNGNHWEGWDADTNGLSSLGVINVVFLLFYSVSRLWASRLSKSSFLMVVRVHQSWLSLTLKGHLRKTGTSLNEMFSALIPVLFYTPVFRTSKLHVLGTILLLFISQRFASRNLVLQYIFYFHPLTNKFVSFFVYF